jgi:hypothetical protein
MIKIYLSVSLGTISGVYGNKMSGLCKPINNNPYRIVFLRCIRQTNNEVHIDVFLFPGWYRQRLKCTSYFQGASLYSLTSITLYNVLGNFSLHPSPTKILFEVLIHFATAWMNREFGKMSFIKNFLSEFMIFRNNNASFKP